MIWWLLLLCSVRILTSSFSAPALFSSNDLHRLCVDYTVWRNLPLIYNGLICGSKDIGTDATMLFQSTGLYHVIVVSGSHLIFMDRYLHKFPSKKFWLRGLALTIYSYVCLLNPPVLRALVQLLFSRFAKRTRLYLRPDQITLGAGLIVLIAAPYLIGSPSLQLSWVAALCMSLNVSPASKACLCLLYIAPLLGLQNPLFALNNILFLAVFDALLFPITVLTFLVPGTTTLANGVWDLTLPLLKWLPRSPTVAPSFNDVTAGWTFVFALQLLHYWRQK